MDEQIVACIVGGPKDGEWICLPSSQRHYPLRMAVHKPPTYLARDRFAFGSDAWPTYEALFDIIEYKLIHGRPDGKGGVRVSANEPGFCLVPAEWL